MELTADILPPTVTQCTFTIKETKNNFSNKKMLFYNDRLSPQSLLDLTPI